MNAVYAILESKYRWLNLAGISFTAACVGAMMMLALTWRHEVAVAWLYFGVAVTIYFCVRALLDWKADAEAMLNPKDENRDKGRNPLR